MALGIAGASGMPVLLMSLDPRDSQNYLDEFSLALSDVVGNDSSWFAKLFEKASFGGIVDGLSESLLDYLDSNWEVMFHRAASLHDSVERIAERLVDDASSRTPDMGGVYYEENLQIVSAAHSAGPKAGYTVTWRRDLTGK